MSKKIRILLLAAFVLVGILSYASKDQFLSVSDAQNKWGKKDFNAKLFSQGDPKIRASMAASLVSSQHYVNRSLNEVRQELGKQTGYYFSDLIPAYAIGDLSQTRTETWQIVFFPDNSSKVVKEIKIHKKCCNK
jgi:hypothetical protein